MKLVSFNVNGLRSRMHQLEELIRVHSPEVVGLQETKVQDADFPVDHLRSLGYHVVFLGQKAHYGVAILSRKSPVSVQYGFPGDGADAQKRLIIATFTLASGASLQVVNGYFPQGESRDHPVKFPAKKLFYAGLGEYLRTSCRSDGYVAVLGDFNIAPEDADVGIGEENARRWLRTGKTSFLPEEREWFATLQSWGLNDSFRALNPDCIDRFSWFDYRSRGFESEPKRGLRIDHILLTHPLLSVCRDAGIDYSIRGMERPSDHCPVWADLELQLT